MATNDSIPPAAPAAAAAPAARAIRPAAAIQSAERAAERAAEHGQWAVLAALGIVFGDLGTSPLYTVQTIVEAMNGRFTPADALGVLSLIVWTLIVTISVKYCLFVMRADNRGEGGILALMSLVGANGFRPGATMLTAMGLLGAAFIYGDGAITPAISVLSALEGVNAASSAFKPFVMPAAVAILLALFFSQKYGSQRIGRAFGPVMLVWFLVIAALGVAAIREHPAVFAALDPRHAAGFLLRTGARGFLVLGGVFLCITGGEALYADMGHFGRGPIRRSWYLIVLPALLLSYAGQTAYVMGEGRVTGNPFFAIQPHWAIYPMVALSTAATIIASQAIITGSFSMTRQAMQLGWFPGVTIRQTSDEVYGQIYVPVINWLLMIATVAITVVFGSSDRLAGAYGTAVATTMLLTTILLYKAMRVVWRWPFVVVTLVCGLFLVVDFGFFSANLIKIAEGGWLPLTFASLLFVVMVTWRAGMDAMHAAHVQPTDVGARFLADLASGAVPRVDGTMVFLTRSRQKVSKLIMDHAHLTGALPRRVIALNVIFEPIPRFKGERCLVIEDIGEGLWHLEAHFGFFEIPDLREALTRVRCAGHPVDFDHAVFVAARDHIVRKPKGSVMRRWRVALFAFLYHNSAKIMNRFNLPPDRVIEIARQVEI